MNILEFLFRNKPWLIKKTINDDIFGLMWFNKDKNSEYNHFQGHLFFKPTNSEIDVFIDSDKLGIDPKQKMFFNEIIEKYSEITDKSSSEITKYLINKHKKPISAINFKREFRLYATSIPLPTSLAICISSTPTA